MCGITGFLESAGQKGSDELKAIVMKMADSIRYRGPDDSGIWVDQNCSVALGHRRLAIVDLSPEGRQPMISTSGRYIINFNGEIYNFLVLRNSLESLGCSFRGHSDTEVMLAAIEEWGLRQAVEKFAGMFSFALWDRKEHILHLVRDRLGIKPLYYGFWGKVFVFGSELKALKAYPGFNGEIDRGAVALFFRHNYIPAPYSIYKGIYKLSPGTILSLNTEDFKTVLIPFWSAKEIAEQGVADPLPGKEEEIISTFDKLLRDVTREHMIADVPLGAFLSGGVDSSTVVSLMQAQSERPVKTFSIGFHEPGFNEAKEAKIVARYLGTEHTELYVTPEEAMDVVPGLPTLYDEPFSDSSQIPTFLVSKLARQHVTVSLSGDGGDELFAGYNRYFWGRSIWKKTGWLPGVLKNKAAKTLTMLSPQVWESLFQKLAPVLPQKVKQQNPGQKLHKLAEVLTAGSPEAMYLSLISHWKDPGLVVIGAIEPPTMLTNREQWADLSDFTQRMMYLDTVSYLPDDILTKVDRASMGVSLEARVPLLDHRVVEFAWRVPLSLKIRNGQGKWLLRQVLYKYVPKDMIERPKMGFGVPIDRWLRGPLKEWANDLISQDRIKREGIFRWEPIEQLWQEHLSGKKDWHYHLWDILMFQAWLEKEKQRS